MNPELKARIKSFLWQMFYMLAGAALSFLLRPDILEMLKVYAPKWMWAMPIVVGMVTQLSKFINNKLEESRGYRPTKKELEETSFRGLGLGGPSL